MRARISTRDYEQLSAYIDGQLTPGERRKLEERLSARTDLKLALEEINRTRSMIRTAPRRRAPRNFTLTPAMVGNFQPGRRSIFIFNLFPALSFASALATLALVAALVLDLAPGLMPSDTAYSQPAVVALEAPVEEQAGGATEMPLQKEAAPQMNAAPGSEAEITPPEILQTEQDDRTVIESPSTGEGLLPQPPIITWSDPNAPQGERTDIVGVGGGGYAPFPNFYGKGGGGDGLPPGYGEVEGGLPGGGLILPLEAAESVGAVEAAPEDQPAPVVTGGGPVLGLPSTEEAGQIEITSAFGEPLSSAGTEADLATEPLTGPMERQAESPEPETRQPNLRLIQVLLALLAIITGVAAFIVRRNRARV